MLSEQLKNKLQIVGKNNKTGNIEMQFRNK